MYDKSLEYSEELGDLQDVDQGMLACGEGDVVSDEAIRKTIDQINENIICFEQQLEEMIATNEQDLATLTSGK